MRFISSEISEISIAARGAEVSRWVSAAAIGFMILFAAFLITSPAMADSPDCPPSACVDLEEAARLKAELRREMAGAGVPPRLLELVDRLPNCADCIRASRLMIVTVHERAVGEQLLETAFALSGNYPDESNTTGGSTYIRVPWSPNSERIARGQIADGRATALHFSLLRGPCVCCPEGTEDVARWNESGGAVRVSPTLFNNQVVNSILSPEQLGPLPRDLYELDPSLTREALEATDLGRNTLPFDFPGLERFVSVVCQQCRALAAQHSTLVEGYNAQREEAAEAYREGDRLLREHIAHAAESQRIAALMAPPTATDPGGFTEQRDLARLREDNRLLNAANAELARSRALLAQMAVTKQEIERLDAELLECDQPPCAAPTQPGPVLGFNLDLIDIDLPDFGVGTVLTGPPGDPGTDEIPLVESGDSVELSGVSLSAAFASPFSFFDYGFVDIAFAGGDDETIAFIPSTAMTYVAITYQDRPFDGGPTGVFLGDTGLDGFIDRDVDVFNAKVGFGFDHPIRPGLMLRPVVYLGYSRVEQSITTELRSQTYADISQATQLSLDQNFYSAGGGAMLEQQLNPWIALYGGLFGVVGLNATDFQSDQQNVCGLCGPDNNFDSSISQSEDGASVALQAKLGARLMLTDRLSMNFSAHMTQTSGLGGFFNPTSGDDLFVDDRPAQIANDDGVLAGLRLGLSARF